MLYSFPPTTTTTTTSRQITLYRGPFPGPQNYTWSPFVTKLEARLRFSNVSYDVDFGSPLQAPRGKIPYVRICWGLDGEEMVCDSEGIIRRLEEVGMLRRLKDGKEIDDRDERERERVYEEGLRALLEDRLYFLQCHERWTQNYNLMRDGVLSTLPLPIRYIVGLLAYRSNEKMLYLQGTSRYTDDEIRDMRVEIWRGVEVLLATARRRDKVEDADRYGIGGGGGGEIGSGGDGIGDGSDSGVEIEGDSMMESQDGDEEQEEDGKQCFWLFGGREPRDIDAVLFGFIASGLVCDAAPDSIPVIRSLPNVMEYGKRIHERYFQEYEFWD